MFQIPDNDIRACIERVKRRWYSRGKRKTIQLHNGRIALSRQKVNDWIEDVEIAEGRGCNEDDDSLLQWHAYTVDVTHRCVTCCHMGKTALCRPIRLVKRVNFGSIESPIAWLLRCFCGILQIRVGLCWNNRKQKNKVGGTFSLFLLLPLTLSSK